MTGAGGRSPGTRPGRWTALAALALLAGCTLVGTPPGSSPGAAPEPGGPAGPGPAEPGPGAAGRGPGGEEVRALWVVRTTLSRPDSVRAMVRRADEAGFNTLLVQVRGRGDAYYRSRWEPAPPSLSGAAADYDPLALVLEEAGRRGLAVHAWVNAHLVNGVGGLADDPGHLVRARPDLLAVPRSLARELYRLDPRDPAYADALLDHARANRDRIEGLYTSPAHPEVQEHLHAVWVDLVERYDLDGLHLDYVRYPSRQFDYSRSALERFRRWVRPRLSSARRQELERARRSDPLAYADALPAAWDEFRRTRITALVRRTYHAVKKRRPDATVSAAVFSDVNDAYRHRFQDWAGWIREGILDVAAPMAYTPDEELFRERIADAVRRIGSGRVWAGIGVYRTTFEGTVGMIRTARRLGTAGVALFSYDWAVRQAGSGLPGTPFLRSVGEEAFGVRVGNR